MLLNILNDNDTYTIIYYLFNKYVQTLYYLFHYLNYLKHIYNILVVILL